MTSRRISWLLGESADSAEHLPMASANNFLVLKLEKKGEKGEGGRHGYLNNRRSSVPHMSMWNLSMSLLKCTRTNSLKEGKRKNCKGQAGLLEMGMVY